MRRMYIKIMAVFYAIDEHMHTRKTVIWKGQMTAGSTPNVKFILSMCTGLCDVTLCSVAILWKHRNVQSMIAITGGADVFYHASCHDNIATMRP